MQAVQQAVGAHLTQPFVGARLVQARRAQAGKVVVASQACTAAQQAVVVRLAQA